MESFQYYGMNRDEALEWWKKSLDSKLPQGTSHLISKWIIDLNVDFKISRPRNSKLGDFRAGIKGRRPQITVNSNLNPYAFLITTIHEFAHLGCFLKYRGRVAPHGKEWKSIYVEMLKEFLGRDIFPEDVELALYKHIRRPKASSCSCPALSRVLYKYDLNGGTLLFDLSPGSHFAFRDQHYELVEKRRTRALCLRSVDSKKFLISGRAQVKVLKPI